MNKVFVVSIDVSNDDIELDRYCRKEIEKIFDSKKKLNYLLWKRIKNALKIRSILDIAKLY